MSSFSSWLGRRNRRPLARPARRTRLWLDRYEDRIVPTIGAYVPPSHFLTNATLGEFTGPLGPRQPLDVAVDFLASRAGDFGLTPADLTDPLVTSQYTDADSGFSHIYLRQQFNGVPVINADFAISVAANGEVISAGGGFVRGLADTLGQAGEPATTMTAADAVRHAATELGLTLEGEPAYVDPFLGPRAARQMAFVLDAPSVSTDPIPAKLVYAPTADGGAVLAWDLVLATPDGDHWYSVAVDARSGAIVAQSDWFDDADYRGVAQPAESPQDGGFAVLSNPANATASPFGWHDTNGVAGAEFTDTRGNNVDAHLDRDANNSADANPPRPSGGAALDFSGYSFNAAVGPNTLQNQNAAVTNLFYYNNLLHDLHYQYGFTESAGNFQVNNYGRGGAGNDAVQADAQDGSGTNNANFGTPSDGQAPRMQMYIWDYASPARDSDLDNGVIIHEYGHGVSNRLTGGPANSNALNSVQSGGMGEGWGDWWALMFTQRATDTINAGYGIGTYVRGQPQSGVGIRRFPYSFNMAVDPLTWDAYGTSGTTSYGVTRQTEVHRTGELWATSLWDMSWLLTNKYGFDANLSTGWSPNPGPAHAGNKLALRLVMEGLKLQPANPSFTQARDAILAADIALNGGNDLYEIWSAFARRGLGQGSSTPNSDSEATPTLSTTLPMLVVNVGPATGAVVSSHPASYTLTVTSPIAAGTLEASDFVVNGQPATGVSYTAGSTTATFTFATDPVTAEGNQAIAIAAGAFTRASDSSAVAAFASNFYFDATPLQVTSVTPAANAFVALPFTTVDVNFNQAIDPASVQTSDLSLVRGTVTGFSLLNGNTTVRFALTDLTTEQSLSLAVAAGAFHDSQGNPNAAFDNGTVTLDIDSLAFPVPLTADAPLGSLAYDGNTSVATIQFAGDTDSFTLDLDANQTVNVTVAPSSTLQPTVAVTGPGTNQSASAATAGSAVTLNLIPISTAGTYTLAVSGVGATTGSFTILVTLNAAPEAESNGGAANDALATAQPLAPGFVNLGGGLQSATVRGRSEVSPTALVVESEPNGTTGTADPGATYYAVPNNNLYQMGISGNISSSTDNDYFNIGILQAGDALTLSQSGAPSGRGTNTDPLVRLYRAGAGTTILASDDDSGPGFDALVYRYTVTTTDTYYVRAHRANSNNTGTYQLGITLENSGTAPNTGGTFTAEVESNNTTGTANNASNAWRAVPYFASAGGTITAGDTDLYSYQFTAGDVVTLRAVSTSALAPQAALLNSAGTAIATEDGTSIVGGASGFSAVYNYVISTTGTYYFRVMGASGTTGSYQADVILSTTSSLGTAPLGVDLYSFALTVGQSASAVIESATAGSLDIAILDAAGAVAVAGVAGATNVDQIAANFVAPVAGTYYLRVGGGPDIDYQATVVAGGTFDAEANDSFATAQPLGASGAALGAISGSVDWYQFTAAVGQVLALSTTTPGGGPGQLPNVLDPRLELYDPNNVLVASDDNSAGDGRNAALAHTAALAGNYRVRVAAAGGTSGEYTVRASVGGGATPPRVGTVVAGDGTQQHRSRVASITVSFDAQVTFAGAVADAFALSRIGGGTVGGFTATANVVGGVTVVTLAGFTGAETEFGSLADGRYRVVVRANQVTANGQQLDGDGNGTGGDDFALDGSIANGLFRLFGDANGDGTNNAFDFGQFRPAFGSSTGQTAYLDFLDFDAGGTINAFDFGQFRNRFGAGVP